VSNNLSNNLSSNTIITTEDAHRAWLTAERIKQIADRLVGLGPFSIGLDGILAPVPLAGTLFSLGAGVWLLAEAVKARASGATLARMLFYVGFRTLVSIVPLEGTLVDILFRGHMMAARALQKDIARRYGEPSRAEILEARRRPFAPRQPFAQPLAT
jgi:hypothetical protein